MSSALVFNLWVNVDYGPLPWLNGNSTNPAEQLLLLRVYRLKLSYHWRFLLAIFWVPHAHLGPAGVSPLCQYQWPRRARMPAQLDPSHWPCLRSPAGFYFFDWQCIRCWNSNKPTFICAKQTSSVLPDSRSSSFSPIHGRILRPDERAKATFSPT